MTACGKSPSSEISRDDSFSYIDSSEIISSTEAPSSTSTSESVQPTYRENRYQNAVYPNDFPDPTVIRHEGVYYAFATGLKSLKSIDLVNWETFTEGKIFPTPKWGTAGANVWAPAIIKIGNQFVMYYSLSVWDDKNPGIGVATAPHPLGPWSDHGKLFTSNEIGVNNSIDPDPFVEDGRVYLTWGSFRGIYGIELTADGLGFIDGSVEAANKNKVHLAGYDTSFGFDVATFEAVNVHKYGEYYYMFVSNGQCCSGAYTYNVRVARSTEILGEYYDASGRSMKSGNVGTIVILGNSNFVATGHSDIAIDDAGDSWLLYHAYQGSDRSKRMLLIDKLVFDKDGWPSVFANSPTNNNRIGPQIYN